MVFPAFIHNQMNFILKLTQNELIGKPK